MFQKAHARKSPAAPRKPPNEARFAISIDYSRYTPELVNALIVDSETRAVELNHVAPYLQPDDFTGKPAPRGFAGDRLCGLRADQRVLSEGAAGIVQDGRSRPGIL